MRRRVLIVGCGDTGRRVAQSCRARGDRVTGLVRSPASAGMLEELGVKPLAADLDEAIPALPRSDVLFYFAPPPPSGEDDPRLQGVLAHLPVGNDAPRLIYISTSGVYGDCGGAWVDEDRPVNPQTARARRRIAAERALSHWGGPYVVLRAPGIYGPDRLPIERLRRGEPVLRDADSPWSNRVHIADLAAIALVAAERASPGAIYNACDDMPTPMGQTYRILARLLGWPAPPEIDWAEAERRWSATRLSFLRESRRLRNAKLREQLGLSLRYPDLESGLAACLAESPPAQ